VSSDYFWELPCKLGERNHSVDQRIGFWVIFFAITLFVTLCVESASLSVPGRSLFVDDVFRTSETFNAVGCFAFEATVCHADIESRYVLDKSEFVAVWTADKFAAFLTRDNHVLELIVVDSVDGGHQSLGEEVPIEHR